MRSVFKIAFMVLLLCSCISLAAAVTVSEDKVPSTNLKSGDKVQVILKLYVEGNYDMDKDIWIKTDLEDARVSVFDVSDTSIPSPPSVQADYYSSPLIKAWVLDGFIIGGSDSKNLKLVLDGTVPDVATKQNVTIVRVSEAEGSSEIRTLKTISREILNPALLNEQIIDVEEDAAAFKKAVDEAAAGGVTVASPIQKYNEAVTAINQAKTLKNTNVAQAQTEITKARNAVIDGISLLEKAEAEYEIAQGDRVLQDVDGMILYFTQNRSMSVSDSRLVPITTKYDLASSKLGDAKSSLQQNQYLNAKSKAIESQNIGNEAYNLSVSLKTEMGEGFALPGISPFLLAIIGIVIVLVGIVAVIYKKFFRWDELG